MNFQSIVRNLERYWEDYGCSIVHPYTTEL
ncbi:glycine--tRNA ligase subunit alpha, partial [Anaplasma phagocytophilum]